LSENAEYTYAKEAQALNEKKIAELEDKLSRAKLIDESAMPSDEILIGAKVKLKDLDSGEELEYTLVAEEEADYGQNKISVSSPVGQGLIDHKVNETLKIQVPAGTLRYKILKITR
jgi:transcription elongation factor GreA